MATARDLITQALITAGVKDPVETPTDEEIARALWQFQRMVEQWDLEGLWPYVSKVVTGSLVAGQAEYTVGTGEDISIARPNRITSFAVSDGSVYYPLTEFSQVDYENSKSDDQARPDFFAYITDLPARIALYNTPDTSYSFRMTYEVVSPTYTLNDTLDLPAGYLGALEYGLAVILADRYGNDLPPTLRQEAIERKTRIKRFNFEPSIVTPSWNTRRGPTDILTNR